jgi:D-psicose/D-tagatose/L-ribulose 3-epimerase
VTAHPWVISATQWTTRAVDTADAMERIAGAGYDAIELAATPGADGNALALAARNAGISVSSLCAVYSLDRDCAAHDDLPRAAARDYLRECLELADTVAAPVIVVVPTYRVAHVYDRAAELERAAETIATALHGVPDEGPKLALEPLNRYETHLLTTLDQAEELRAMIDSPRVGLMADLFHMRIEEDSTEAALQRHARRIVHVHLADNQRRHPGSGELDLRAALRVLHTQGYDGALAMEFLPADAASLAAGLQHVRRIVADDLSTNPFGGTHAASDARTG